MLQKNRLLMMPARMARGLCCGLFLLLFCGYGHAQTIVPPVLPDILFPTGPIPGTVNLINSAMIDYSPYCPTPGACGTNQLIAIVVQDGASGNALYVSDGVSSPISFGLPSGTITPDVAIANSTTTPGNFLVGVVYTSGNDVILYVTEYANVGTTTPGITPVGGNFYNISNSGSAELYPHIDVIAEYNNTGISGGLPLCDRFMAMWTDVTSGSLQFGSNIYYSSMSSPIIGALLTNDPTPVLPGMYNDIAAIQRTSGGTPGFMGLYVYHSAGNLYYREWGVSTGFSPPTLLDPIAPGGENPRIDAIDDINVNTLPGVMPYLIASGFVTNVKIYDNATGLGGFNLTSALSPTPSRNPSVTSGLRGAYTVGHFGADGFNHMYAEEISNSSGFPVGYPFFSYYWVNKNMGLTTPATSVSVSSSCNTQYVSSLSISQYLLSCWMEGSGLYYKLEPATVFKSTDVGTVHTLSAWLAYPNPVQDELTLSAPADQLQDANYTITDVAGRTVLSGAITAAHQQVHMNTLPTGTYVVNMYQGTKQMKVDKVVKE